MDKEKTLKDIEAEIQSLKGKVQIDLVGIGDRLMALEKAIQRPSKFSPARKPRRN